MTAVGAPTPGTRAGRRPAGVAGHQAGMTLVELLVAMTIGLFLIGGALYVYSQSRNSYQAGDSLARLQESARFALDTLEPDVRLAGYWGRHAEPALVTVAAGLAVTCASGGADATDWALDRLDEPAGASDDAYDLPCPAFNGTPRAGSDVLVVRHVSGEQVTPEAGQIQALSTLGGSLLVNDGTGPGPEEIINDVVVNAYYINDRSSFDPALPSLRQLTLARNGVLRDEEVIPGVENLQVQFGLDANRDGTVERYVDPDDPAVAGARIGAVRLWLLVGTPAEESGYQDAGSYQPLDGDLAPIVPGEPGYPADYRRLAVTKTIQLRNQSL